VDVALGNARNMLENTERPDRRYNKWYKHKAGKTLPVVSHTTEWNNYNYDPNITQILICYITINQINIYTIIKIKMTFAIIAVFAPSLAAITHWFAPFPPKPIENLSPCSVSPTLGNRGTLLTQSTLQL